MACHSVMLKLELVGGLYCVGRNYVRLCGFGSMDTWYVMSLLFFFMESYPKLVANRTPRLSTWCIGC